MKIEYSSNNSGGHWWLKDKDWTGLEKAGWMVNWYKGKDNGFFRADNDGRWLGALASSAKREGLSLKDAIAEWEKVTGQDSSDLGCSCCGAPHSFTEYDGDKYIRGYSPDYPDKGERFSG